MNTTRIKYLDILRAISMIAVLGIHISSQYELDDLNFYQQIVFTFFGNFVQWADFMFCAISGALLLNKNEIKTSDIFTKYVKRLFFVYIFWSLFYSVLYLLKNNFEIGQFLKHFILGEYHLWFLPMLVGLYILVPVLKKIVDSKQSIIYFMFLCFIVLYLYPLLNNFEYFSELSNWINNFSVSCFLLCFIMGYYIFKYDIKKQIQIIAYFIGVLSFICPLFLSIFNFYENGNMANYSHIYNDILCFFQTISIFVFAKYNLENTNSRIMHIFEFLSKYSFGIYLIHPFVMEILEHFEINILMFDPIISFLIVMLLTLIISLFISFMMKKIPVVNKIV